MSNETLCKLYIELGNVLGDEVRSARDARNEKVVEAACALVDGYDADMAIEDLEPLVEAIRRLVGVRAVSDG